MPRALRVQRSTRKCDGSVSHTGSGRIAIIGESTPDRGAAGGSDRFVGYRFGQRRTSSRLLKCTVNEILPMNGAV